VTVATALVASQAVLCAVIGWITFGGHDQPAHSNARAAEPVLGPPIVVPPASVAPVESPAPSSQHHSPARNASSTPRPTSAPARTVGPPAAPSRTVATTGIAPKPPVATPTGAGKALRPTPSASEVQGNAEVGKKCDPEDANGVTADDIAVRCVRDSDGNLVWQID
jgi:hypothetical protein